MNWIGQRSESEAAPGETLLDRGPRLVGKIGDPRPRRRETREAPPAPALRALDLAQPDSLAEALAHDRAELAGAAGGPPAHGRGRSPPLPRRRGRGGGVGRARPLPPGGRGPIAPQPPPPQARAAKRPPGGSGKPPRA